MSTAVRPSFAAFTRAAVRPDLGVGRQSDRLLDVHDGDAAVGPVDDHRQALAHAQLLGDIAKLDHGPDRGQVRRDGHEDAIGLVEQGAVERAVGRVEVDDDVVHVAPGDRYRAGHALGLEDLGMDRADASAMT
jgi:hypothetical protein